MKNSLKYLIGFVLLMSMVSCATKKSLNNPPSATSSGSRTIILDGDTISENDYGGFESWTCKDYINGGPILVEIGYFGNPLTEELGFILYDGGYSGEYTLYQRTGLNHRWDWANGDNYAFTINPDGTGSYYDFSLIPVGESTKPSSIYKCKKR